MQIMLQKQHYMHVMLRVLKTLGTYTLAGKWPNLICRKNWVRVSRQGVRFLGLFTLQCFCVLPKLHCVSETKKQFYLPDTNVA
jgi:hypothetical protein